MPRWGLVIDLDRCTGCQACVVACKHENNVPFSTPEVAAEGRLMTWVQLVPVEMPGGAVTALPLMCQQCDRPPCVDVCPTSATYLNPEGIVAQIYARCIGCRYCTNACPYAVKVFNWTAPRWPASMTPMRNQDVSIRPKGVVEKCTFCHHRLIQAREQARAEGRELGPDDYVPACVQTCPAEAMVFGDLDDPHSEVSALATSPRAFRWMEDLGTNPKVVYQDRVPAHVRVLGAFTHRQPRLHGAPRSTRIRVLVTVAERPSSGALGRADLWPARREQWREMRANSPTLKTGTLSAAVVARHVVMRIEAVGHSGRAVLSNGQAIQLRFGGAPRRACPESNAVGGCESLMSKRHCVRSRFRTVLESGGRLSVVAFAAAAFSAPRGVFLSRRVCSEHGR